MAPRTALLLSLDLVLATAAASCTAPDPRQELEVADLETYWAIDASVGQTRYLAPCVRFRLRNKGRTSQGYVQATATFRRKGEETQTWGSGFEQVAASRKPLGAGREVIVALKSDGRYYSTGTPESMFEHKFFKDAKVEVYFRVGSSSWVRMAEADVERRIGSKSVALAEAH